MRHGVGALALVLGLLGAAGASAVPADSGEAAARQAEASRAQRYAEGVGWWPGVSSCQIEMLQCTTTWHDVIGEKPPRLVVVHAGAEGGRGLLQMETRAWDPWQTRGEDGPVSRQLYPAPAPFGRLTILGGSGHIVWLQTDTGERLLFDLEGRTYVTHP